MQRVAILLRACAVPTNTDLCLWALSENTCYPGPFIRNDLCWTKGDAEAANTRLDRMDGKGSPTDNSQNTLTTKSG